MTRLVFIWIWLCAWLNCTGWFLSAIHQLNPIGYALSLAVGFGAFLVWKMSSAGGQITPAPPSHLSHKLFRRFRRPAPFAFLVLAALAFLGGAIHAPNNYDGLAYRVTRVLHWLAAGQWHWIHTIFPRVNNRACGIEWLSAPLISLFKTDRLLFLINIISFLLLPGLAFSVLTRCGVRSRVAWYWMWIVPSGYCFILQAGSISNDSFAAPFALAAIDFALRAKTSRRPRDFFASILAAALLTGAKAGNVALLLPWAIAILPSLKIILRRPLATVVICIMAVFSSFLPSAIINYHYCHDWTGLALEDMQSQGSPFVRIPANLVLISVLNLSPPVFPEADRWNRFVQKTIPPDLSRKIQYSLAEPGAYQFLAPEMQMEENAGLGFGVTLLLFASMIAVAVHNGRALFHLRLASAEDWWRRALIVSPWISTFALLSQSTIYPVGRILAPCYILLLPLLLVVPGHGQLVKKTWWRAAASIVFAMAAGLLIISPSRPLFPVGTLLDQMAARHINSKIAMRTAEVYSVYRDRNYAFQPALDRVPPGLKTLGFISYDAPETALWHPFGSRNIVHVCPGDSPAYLKTKGVEYILADADRFGQQFPPYAAWLQSMNAQTVQTIPLNLRAMYGTNDWYLVKLN